MEREPRPSDRKLTEVVKQDYPTASEVLVSFPEEWEFVQTLKSENRTLYVGALPLSREHPTRHHFEGLRPEINVSLVFYRLYRFFQAWPQPRVLVEWNEQADQGRVAGYGDLHLQLQPVGQAQAWFGLSHAVLWECYLDETNRRGNWPETLAEVWQLVERDLHVSKILTLPHEPAFEEGYTYFLSRLGYAVDPENPEWWSKMIQHDHRPVTGR
jgi:hypothetical protein